MPDSAGVVKNTPTLITQAYSNSATASTIVAAGTNIALCGVFFSGQTAGDYITVDEAGGGANIMTLLLGAAGATYMSLPHPLILSNGIGVTINVSVACRYTLIYAEV